MQDPFTLMVLFVPLPLIERWSKGFGSLKNFHGKSSSGFACTRRAMICRMHYTELYWAIRLYGSLLTPTRLLAAKDKSPCFLPSSISLQSSNQITRIGCASEMLMLWKVLSCNVTNSACCFCRYTLECIHFIIYICISDNINDASDIFIPCKNSRCSSVFYEPQKVIPDGPPQSSCKQASRTFTNLKLSWQSFLKPTQPRWTKAVTENRPTVVFWCIM